MAAAAAISTTSGSDSKGEMSAKDAKYLAWLKAHGARFPKIKYPAFNTVEGVRGTVALADIAPEEKMLCIPSKLLISPPNTLKTTIAHVFKDPRSFPRRSFGAEEITVMLMHEKLRGEASFYHPYIDVLPEPSTTELWSDEDLAECQDSRFTPRTMSLRREKHSASYRRLIGRLVDLFPDVFSFERYTLELYLFATRTVQARAFGRRLSWMALVPFADNLNHANVSTKYDMDVNGNGMFRLYPTNGNCYKKGKEVFNSYGRRDNQHLLIYYGFTLINNEWDVFELNFKIKELMSCYQSAHTRVRSKLLREPHMIQRLSLFEYVTSVDQLSVKFRGGQLMWQLLFFARISCLPESAAKDMLSHLTYQEIDMQYDTDKQIQDTTVHGTSICSSAALARLPKMCTETRLEMPLSFEVELLAVETCIHFLVHRLSGGGARTSLKHDAFLLQDKSISHNLRSAINLRIYRKRLLLRNLLWLRVLRDTMKGSIAARALLMRRSSAVCSCCCTMADTIELAGAGVGNVHKPVVLPASVDATVAEPATAVAWGGQPDTDLCVAWVQHIEHLKAAKGAL